MTTLLFLVVAIAVITFIFEKNHFDKSDYASQTGNSYLRTMFNKGSKGEYSIASRLEHLISSDLRVLYNLYIPLPDGRTSEIDTILIGRQGIYVIEVKNRAGYIYGNLACRELNQKIGRQFHKVYNPIFQNNGHIAALKRVLPGYIRYFSIIAFADNAILSLHGDSDASIIHFKDIHAVISANESKDSGVALSPVDIETIYNILLQYTNADISVKKAHVRAIKAIHINQIL